MNWYRFNNRAAWHKWFAWYPITVGQTSDSYGRVCEYRVWLEFIERREVPNDPESIHTSWQYRVLPNPLHSTDWPKPSPGPGFPPSRPPQGEWPTAQPRPPQGVKPR